MRSAKSTIMAGLITGGLVLAAACGSTAEVRPVAESEQPLAASQALTEGVRYRASGPLQDIDVVFTAPSEPVHARVSTRAIGLSHDRAGADPAVSLLLDSSLRVYPSPLVSPQAVTAESLGTLTDAAPADLIAWLADRPFLDAGRVSDELRIGRLEGRGFPFTVRDLPEGALACGAPPAPACAPLVRVAGTTLHVRSGDRGWMLMADVAGQRVLAVVHDGTATSELLETLQLQPVSVPEGARAATRLPYFAEALDPGRTYYVDKIDPRVGLELTAPRRRVTASQEEAVAWFGDPDQSPAARHYYLTVFRADGTVANPDPTLDPYAIVGPSGITASDLATFLARTRPLPADPVTWLAEQPYVSVVVPPRDIQVGGAAARAVDVRVGRPVGSVPCPDGTGRCVMAFAQSRYAFPMVLSSEYVTRVLVLDAAGHRLLIAADLGTPGEDILESLRIVR